MTFGCVSQNQSMGRVFLCRLMADSEAESTNQFRLNDAYRKLRRIGSPEQGFANGAQGCEVYRDFRIGFTVFFVRVRVYRAIGVQVPLQGYSTIEKIIVRYRNNGDRHRVALRK